MCGAKTSYRLHRLRGRYCTRARSTKIWEPPFLIASPGSSFAAYRPLTDHPALFLEFAETPPTREGILDFANRYGALFRFGEVELVEHGDGDEPVLLGETLATWRAEIADMRHVWHVWSLHQARDEAGLRRLFRWWGSPPGPYGVEYVVEDEAEVEQPRALATLLHSATGARTPLHERCRFGDVFLPALFRVRGIINAKLLEHPSMPCLVVDTKNRLNLHVRPTSLLAAMWLQFGQAVLGKKYRRCRVCGRWEDVTERDPRWVQHKECGARLRSARNYAKKKQRHEGEVE